MLNFNVKTVKELLGRLSEVDPEREIFGAAKHRYQLGPCVEASVILAFEERYELRLPEDYRSFLLEIGNGGAGPNYGLFPFEFYDRYRIGDLRKPFPHTQAWNMPKEWFHSFPDPYGGRAAEALKGVKTIKAKTEVLRSLPKDEEAVRKLREMNGWYYSPDHANGAIPICHEGCGYIDLLILRGEARGTIWCDDRCSHLGLVPWRSRTSNPYSFGFWYMEWLERSLAERNHPPTEQ